MRAETEAASAASSTATPLIEIRDLTVRYHVSRTGASLTALEHVDLEVYEGEILTLLGPSGCGKTTLLNVIAGLVKPSAGGVVVGGRPVTGPGPDRAVVFQDYALLPWRTVFENVRLGLEMQPRLRKTPDARVNEAIELVGLSGFESSYPRELSGGMQQRVGLARALVAEPQIMLMDEPLGAVDALTREVMRTELERIIGLTGKTVVFITHSIDEAILLGDRVVLMQSHPGRIQELLPSTLPRPRGEDVRAEPEYLRLRDHLWQALRGTVQRDARGER